jgi:hypothetical protein
MGIHEQGSLFIQLGTPGRYVYAHTATLDSLMRSAFVGIRSFPKRVVQRFDKLA